MFDDIDMHLSFKQLWGKLSFVYDDCNMNYILLESLYRTNRHYHTLGHVKNCLGELEAHNSFGSYIQESDWVEFAIWYHDAIYSIGDSNIDSEVESCKFVKQVLRSQKVDSVKVKTLILATKHNRDLVDIDSQIIADIDLAILGKDEATFNGYEKNIRKEYSRYNDATYKNGRIKVLQMFLNKKQIYYRDYFKNRYEEQARKNLQKSIEELS